MLLQTNSYIVPKEKRTEHARLVKRFRALMARLGCTDFQCYEQAGPNWTQEVGGRFVQIMRFRDRDHQKAVRDAEQSDASAQDLVREFCELINFAYQHQRGLATTAFYIEMGCSPGPAKTATGAEADRGDALPPAETPPVNGSQRAAHDVDDDLSDLTSTGPFRTGTPARQA